MSAAAVLNPGTRFDAVLFDCDGVLVDSEAITNGILRDMLGELGWRMSEAECMRTFVGKSLTEERSQIETRTGKPLSEDWFVQFRERRNQGLIHGLQPIRNIGPAVALVHERFQGRIACASGADRFKVELQLKKCGLMPYFKGRIFSGYEVPHNKPAPDIYLAAASALGVDPRRCVVVEDSVTGATAGVAAGATVFGFSPSEAGHSAPDALKEVGAAVIFTDMAELPVLLERAASR